jgi:hypothetical protein
MNWHLSPFATIHDIANALINNLVNSEAPPDVRSLLPVLSINPIFTFKPSCRANYAGMLSK